MTVEATSRFDVRKQQEALGTSLPVPVIDLFAGPGRCVLSDDSGEFDGSPILALNTKVPFTTYRTLTDGRRVDLIYLFPDAMDLVNKTRSLRNSLARNFVIPKLLKFRSD